jgi:hypothetical protein
MGLGDKAAAFKLIEQALVVMPIEKDAIEGPIAIGMSRFSDNCVTFAV